jgi:hypothetical protein
MLAPARHAPAQLGEAGVRKDGVENVTEFRFRPSNVLTSTISLLSVRPGRTSLLPGLSVAVATLLRRIDPILPNPAAVGASAHCDGYEKQAGDDE